MKKIFLTTVALAVMIIFVASAQAININSASVINGSAAVSGGKAVAGSTIRWEGQEVTKANKNGGFSFSFGVVPADCVGILSDGTSTMEIALANCTPTATAKVLKTGQTTSYATGDDGDIQAGAPVPSPRFTVNVNAADDTGVGGGIAGNGICDGTESCNGTVTDNLTGLIWLKNANCFGRREWATAISDANGLADGACGLTDGSVAGDWRLPNRNELMSLLDLGKFSPSLPSGNPFTNVELYYYWSSTIFAPHSGSAWLADFNNGALVYGWSDSGLVIAVRGGL